MLNFASGFRAQNTPFFFVNISKITVSRKMNFETVSEIRIA